VLDFEQAQCLRVTTGSESGAVVGHDAIDFDTMGSAEQPALDHEHRLLDLRRLDRLHLDYPFAGSRMLRGLLALQGCKIGRRHKTLMRRMGIEALYRRGRSHRNGKFGTNVNVRRS
jgi:hypothetical protein